MTAITADEFKAVLDRGALREAQAHLGIGRALSFADGPARQVVVHFGADDSEQYLRDVTDRILSLEDEWLLAPRHGAVAALGLLGGETDAAAVRFTVAERERLSEYLCTRSVDVGTVSADLYAVSDSGSILVTWDHHTAEEGLNIDLRRIRDATRLLGALNDLGTELDLFFAGAQSDAKEPCEADEVRITPTGPWRESADFWSTSSGPRSWGVPGRTMT